MSYYGRLCVGHLDRGFDDAEFWAQWMDRLHPDERRALVNGEIGVIKRPLEPTWPAGEWMKVASNYWIRPDKPRFTHRGWRISFAVRDFRPRLMRRVPQVFEPPALDAEGRPVSPSLDAIKAARLDGSYTTSHALAVPESEEEVDEMTQRRYSVQGRKAARDEANEIILAAEDVRQALRERAERTPEFRKLAGRSMYRISAELDRVIANAKRKAA